MIKKLFISLTVFFALTLITTTPTFAIERPLLTGCHEGETLAGPGATDGTVECTSIGGGSTLARPTASVGAIPSVGKVDKTKLPVLSLNDLIKNGVLISIALAGLIFFFMLILGGLKYLGSGGDEKAMASARNTLTAAFIGLVIVVAALVVSQLLFAIFGLQGVSVSN